MTQEQNEQYSSSLEQLDEQELQTTTGGCVGCEHISQQATEHAIKMNKEYKKDDYLEYKTLSDSFQKLSERAKGTATHETDPCVFHNIHRIALDSLKVRLPYHWPLN